MRDKSQNFGSSSSQRSVNERDLLDLSADGRNRVHHENKALHSVRLLRLDGMRQRGDVLSGGSYLSSNDLRGHFGIGDATEAGTAEIHRPIGKRETVRLPAVDRIYTIEEGLQGWRPFRKAWGRTKRQLCGQRGRGFWPD